MEALLVEEFPVSPEKPPHLQFRCWQEKINVTITFCAIRQTAVFFRL